MAKTAAARAVMEAKTKVWEEFREAMEMDFRLATRKFWQTVRQSQKGKQGSAEFMLSKKGQLLTVLGDVVR